MRHVVRQLQPKAKYNIYSKKYRLIGLKERKETATGE